MLLKYTYILRRWFFPNIKYTFFRIKNKTACYFFFIHTQSYAFYKQAIKLKVHEALYAYTLDNLNTHKIVRVNSTKKI